MGEIDYKSLGKAYKRLTEIDKDRVHSAKRAARKPIFAIYELMKYICDNGLSENAGYVEGLESLRYIDVKASLDYRASYDEREAFLEGFYEE